MAQLLGYRADLRCDLGAVLGIPEQRLDPGLGPVVGLDLVLHQQPSEHDAHPDVGEGPKGEDLLGRVDQLVQARLLRLDLADEGLDRPVDERHPELRHRFRILGALPSGIPTLTPV